MMKRKVFMVECMSVYMKIMMYIFAHVSCKFSGCSLRVLYLTSSHVVGMYVPESCDTQTTLRDFMH
jgi:hypothetical protein